MVRSEKLDMFVAQLNEILESSPAPDESQLLPKAKHLLGELVKQDDWLEEKYTRPDANGYRQYCLYVCPKNRFSVVSFVWGPGQRTPVHDHTVWGVIGMLRGAEVSERYGVQEDGSFKPEGKETLFPGMVDCVSPRIGDIHQVSNFYEDQVSISIHVYGADIGKVSRHVYDLKTGQTKTFVSGYTPVA